MRVVVQVVIAQERMSNNDVYCFKKRQPHKFQWVCETRSSIERGMKSSSTMYLQVGPPTHPPTTPLDATPPVLCIRRHPATFIGATLVARVWLAELHTCPFSPSLQLYSPGRQKGNTIGAVIPYIREDLPVVILFRALGMVNDREVLSHIVYDLEVREGRTTHSPPQPHGLLLLLRHTHFGQSEPDACCLTGC